jgi:hypothetical protein
VRYAIHLLALSVLALSSAKADFFTSSELTTFDAAYGPYDASLDFVTNLDGTDHYNPTGGFFDNTPQFKPVPGDYFSHEVTFSSPDAGNPDQVLWGHYDDDVGGIAPATDYTGVLRLDFNRPVDVVRFRDPGVQPGINVFYYSADGTLIGEVLGTASSFVGAASSEPISYLTIEGAGGQAFAISYLDLNYVPEANSFVVLLAALAATGLVSLFKKLNFRT